MPLYLIGHEEINTSDMSLMSTLTSAGKQRANTLVQQLDQLEIEHVFSSPFLCCIQTVLPYCWKHGIHVRVENSLYDFVSSVHVSRCDIERTMSDETKIALGIKNAYKSQIHLDEIELDEYPMERVTQFVEYIKSMFSPTSSVLICTHKDCINNIIGNPRGTAGTSMGKVIQIH